MIKQVDVLKVSLLCGDLSDADLEVWPIPSSYPDSAIIILYDQGVARLGRESLIFETLCGNCSQTEVTGHRPDNQESRFR
jgi:hypothetical protein